METGELRARLAKYHAHVDVAFCGWNGAWLDPGVQGLEHRGRGRRWRVPALLIQGADDQYGTLAQIRAIEARSPAPVKSLILDRCRHSPQVDQPQATLDAIVGFCAQVAAPPRADGEGKPRPGAGKQSRWKENKGKSGRKAKGRRKESKAFISPNYFILSTY